MLIGDVLFAFGILVATSATLWCATVFAALVYPARAAQMAARLSARPMATGWVGASIVLPLLTLALILAQVPAPIAKVLALILLLAMALVAALGSGGIVRMVADRLRAGSPDLSMLGAAMRGAGLLIGMANIPVLGWFVIAPSLLILSTGLFAQGLFGRAVAVPWESIEP